MDYKTFEILRSYCRTDLVAYIDTPGSGAMYALYERLHGPIGELLYEQQTAMRIFQFIDLTPKEKHAANMLAVINNHRAITWQREPKTPDGRPPAEPLERWQADKLWTDTRAAIVGYDIACSGDGKLPLLTLLDSLAPEQNSQKPAPVETVGVEPVPVLSEATARAQLLPDTNAPNFSVKKAAMIRLHIANWPDIKTDMKGASTNGLSAAKAGERGWHEANALDWARAKGRLVNTENSTRSVQQPMDILRNLPSLTHKLKG
jgi:hypothetical protein